MLALKGKNLQYTQQRDVSGSSNTQSQTLTQLKQCTTAVSVPQCTRPFPDVFVLLLLFNVARTMILRLLFLPVRVLLPDGTLDCSMFSLVCTHVQTDTGSPRPGQPKPKP
jgi:hypothetical protein